MAWVGVWLPSTPPADRVAEPGSLSIIAPMKRYRVQIHAHALDVGAVDPRRSESDQNSPPSAQSMPMISHSSSPLNPAQIDRLLRPARAGQPRKGLGTTRPGTLLRHQAPTRGGPADTSPPGAVAVDTVAHCDDTTTGDYVNSLTFTSCSAGGRRTARSGTRAATPSTIGLRRQSASQLPRSCPHGDPAPAYFLPALCLSF
jgi:hypothetical protein